MKRNTKILVQAARSSAEREKTFAENQNKMMGIVKDLQEQVLRLSSKFDMQKKEDIDNYFPVKVDSDLDRFLNKGDGQFKIRQEEFENWLYCTVTKNIRLKRPFETSLLAAVFTRDYIKSHKWPGPR